MQSIQSIIDFNSELGFSYFYGISADDEGYLRRMLHTNPSFENILTQLKDDVYFVSKIGKDYFDKPRQLKAFKLLLPYLKQAKKHIKSQIEKNKTQEKSFKKKVKNEIESLEKELQSEFLSEEEFDRIEWEIRTLQKPQQDDLSETKVKFSAIDRKVKEELRKLGLQDEEDVDELEDYESLPPQEAFAFESVKFDIDKLVDDNHRRYTMGEFVDLYEDTMSGQQNPASANDPITRKNNMTQQKLRQDRIKNLISKKKLPKTVSTAQLAKMTDDQIAALENS